MPSRIVYSTLQYIDEDTVSVQGGGTEVQYMLGNRWQQCLYMDKGVGGGDSCFCRIILWPVIYTIKT